MCDNGDTHERSSETVAQIERATKTTVITPLCESLSESVTLSARIRILAIQHLNAHLHPSSQHTSGVYLPPTHAAVYMMRGECMKSVTERVKSNE